MTEKEIEALAREYADELFKDDDLTDIQTQDEKNDCYVQCMAFLGFVKDRYEIVAKEKVRELKDKLIEEKCAIIEKQEQGYLIPTDTVRACLGLLESLFPQTLKTEER